MLETWNSTLRRKAGLLAGVLALTAFAYGMTAPKAEASLCCSVCRENYLKCDAQCPNWQMACGIECENGYTFCLETCNTAC